jgi:hypothetical protein
MSKHKLPHPYSWYYKSFAVDNKCPFCGSDQIYSTKDNDVIYCSSYNCYVSLQDCESQMPEHFGEEAEGSCKMCGFEPSIFCPMEKTSISMTDCKEKREHTHYCKSCKSIEIMLPTQGSLTSDLVYVCDSCDKGVDFTKLKQFEKWSN